MNPPMIPISAYPAWVGKDGKPKPGCIPHDTDLYKELHRIQQGYYKPIVDTYRGIINKDEAYKFKVTKLPSLTISGVFKKWRKIENLVQHTGLLNIDIDAKQNKEISDWPVVRDRIFDMEGVVAAFLSVSGVGCTFIVKVNPEQHKDTFFSIVDGLKLHFNIQADTGLHDVTRLRFVSDDPECRIREDFSAIPVSQPTKDYLESKKNYSNQTISLEPVGEADSEYNFGEAVKRAQSSYHFVDGQKHSFMVCLAGCCNIMGMSLEYAEGQVLQQFLKKSGISPDNLLKPLRSIYKIYKHQHASYNNNYRIEQLNEKARNFIIPFLHQGIKPDEKECLEFCKENGINPERIQQLVDRIYNEYSDELGYDFFPQVKKVELWLNKRYTFKFNLVTGQPEMTEQGTEQPITVNPDEIYRQLQLGDVKFSLNNIKSLIKSSFVKPYDPIREYFQPLTWDGKTDYISRLANYIKTEEGEFWPKMFRKALIRSIPCGLGIKENRIVMVLYQRKEETGKSSYIRFLNPWRDKYFTESPIIGGNIKDTEIRFSENFIYNIEELAGLNRADVNKLKADISKAGVKERRPHGMFEEYRPRRCNFWASTNQKEFLHDEGNTRWLIFEINDINWSYSNQVNINQVWGQAWHLFQNGESGELDKEDRAIREYLNKDYRFVRPEEELISRHFKPAEPKTSHFYSSTEIAVVLNKISPTLRVSPNAIGRAMREIYSIQSTQAKIDGKSIRGYWLHNSFKEVEGEQGRSAWPPVSGKDTQNFF